MIWYSDFTATAQQSSGGGKGFGGGGGGGTSYTYSAALILGLAQGPISAILGAWDNQTPKSLATLNFTAFLGNYTQNAWGYVTAGHPAEAMPYRGIAYVAAGPFDLGSSSSPPNLTFEVVFNRHGAIAGSDDADPADVISDFLTEPNWGLGFPSARLASLATYSGYCRASGLVISPILSSQSSGQQSIADWLKATNSEAVWSSGVLSVVPYGDADLSANGATYTAPTAPQYDLTDDDFISSGNTPPVIGTRKPSSAVMNSVRAEYLDRANSYNPAISEAKNDADIVAFGLRSNSVLSYHFFCMSSAAQMSAMLALGREQIRMTYAFTIGRKFIRLDPMDIVSITDANLGLTRQWVRILEIQENADLTLAVTAEEYLNGTASAPVYGHQANTGFRADWNADPGMVNAPIIFEPTDQLANGLAVWGAVSGINKAVWGGCDVWISYGGTDYQHAGQIIGPARMGLLTANLPTTTVNPTGATVDATNILAVDLSQSGGELIAVSQADALAGNTLCYVGGECIAYANTALTGADAYDLSYLVRGLYGTEANVAAHPIGTPIARLDQGIFKLPFDQSRIGATVSLKFLSFNIYGGGEQSLSDVPAYGYTITGAALASPLPNIVNIRTVYEAGFTKIWWDEVNDFRQSVRYIVKKGATFNSALQVADVAHPPFVAFGDDTYWVTAYCQPASGLLVYSESPISIAVAGSLLVQNVIALSNQQTAGWLGSFSNTQKQGTDPTAFVRLTTIGKGATGTYQIPPSDVVDIGFVANCPINVTWSATGTNVGANILSIASILAEADILGSAAAAFVDVFPEISIGTTNDIFAAADAFAPADVFDLINWGAWQKFVPGVYRGRFFRFRWRLTALADNIIPFLLAASYQVTVPPRLDHYVGVSVASAGTTFTFQPDGASTPGAFNGGPNGSTVPFISVTWPNVAGDTLSIVAISKTSVTIQILNAGVGVARSNVNVIAEGY
jgi:hypothetical protein